MIAAKKRLALILLSILGLSVYVASGSLADSHLPGTETQITSDPSIQDVPDISGNRIVWRDLRNGKADVYLYDIETGEETQITDDPGGQSGAFISGSRIVWCDSSGIGTSVYAYEIATGTEQLIATTSDSYHSDCAAHISGDRVVWQRYAPENANYVIELHDLSTGETRLIADGGVSNYNPRISGDRIVWRTDEQDVLLYDLRTGATTTLVDDAPGAGVAFPDISEAGAIWLRKPLFGSPWIEYYDFDSPEIVRIQQLIMDPLQFPPRISGRRIVWSDGRNEATNADIYLWDLDTETETRLTDSPGSETWPAISDDRIVWTDDRSGDKNIYLFDFTPPTVCGNAVLEDGESCDDGNTDAGDCCSAACELEPAGSACEDDGNVCTDDVCDGAGACEHPANTVTCDDGDACTELDVCQGGVCSGTTVDCDDANPCTDDGCDIDLGCQYVANTLPCEDGNACTEGDVCSGGSCAAGLPVVCDDENPCTDDGCDTDLGCQYTDNTLPCEDGDLCTVLDTCQNSVCRGTHVDCDDGDSCTDDQCDGLTGLCSNTVKPDGAACTDGVSCTADDFCLAGICIGPDACQVAQRCSRSEDECAQVEGFFDAPIPVNEAHGDDEVWDGGANLTNGGGTWGAGWVSYEGEGTAMFTRSYDDYSSCAPLTSCDAARPALTWWEPPKTLSDARGASGPPQLATDGAGIWVAVWESPGAAGNLEIHVSRSADDGKNWSIPSVLGGEAASALRASYAPTVASDGSDHWLIVYTVFPGGGSSEYLLASYSEDDGLIWSDPAPVRRDPSGMRSDSVPFLATDGWGNWGLVWQAVLDGNPEIFSALSSDGGAQWFPPIRVTENDAEDWEPILVASNGSWTVVWQSSDSLGGEIGADRDLLMVRSYLWPSEGWGEPRALNTDAAGDAREDVRPRIAVDGAGHWLAVWTTWGGELLAARSVDDGATWRAPFAPRPDPVAPEVWEYSSDAATDSLGTWAIAWESNDPLDGSIGTDTDILSMQMSWRGEDVASRKAVAGELVGTGDAGAAASETDPVETFVTAATPGVITIVETTSDYVAPDGYQLLGQQVTITAPPATPENPLRIVFRIHASIAQGTTAETIELFKVVDGYPLRVEDCDPLAAGADPDPCIASRASDGDDIVLTVLSATASDWLFGYEIRTLEVALDVKPGSDENPIDPQSRGVIPVAILTRGDFSAVDADPASVRFGPTGSEAAASHWAFEDVDGDGAMDQILHFETQETGIVCGDTTVRLTGRTFHGHFIQGSDQIVTVACP